MAHAGVRSYKQRASHTKHCVQDNHLIVLPNFFTKNLLVIVTMLGVVSPNVEEHACGGLCRQQVNLTKE